MKLKITRDLEISYPTVIDNDPTRATSSIKLGDPQSLPSRIDRFHFPITLYLFVIICSHEIPPQPPWLHLEFPICSPCAAIALAGADAAEGGPAQEAEVQQR